MSQTLESLKKYTPSEFSRQLRSLGFLRESQKEITNIIGIIKSGFRQGCLIQKKKPARYQSTEDEESQEDTLPSPPTPPAVPNRVTKSSANVMLADDGLKGKELCSVSNSHSDTDFTAFLKEVKRGLSEMKYKLNILIEEVKEIIQ
ncbi:uncharacterized protein LOC124163765 [Ischnura elegans]|uniref:uncharacterized protein LOC124163765 n=1 Tax=Ischnura elegans TaxID=197161 RepID=UPI001ED8913E|nr:uncharacterized protein LOC124163765 [Ischnura elegans]